MNKLNSNNIKLLDKIYNLKSSDSVILTSMEKEKEKAITTRDNTSERISDRIKKLRRLSEQIPVIAWAGDKDSQKFDGNRISWVKNYILEAKQLP